MTLHDHQDPPCPRQSKARAATGSGSILAIDRIMRGVTNLMQLVAALAVMCLLLTVVIDTTGRFLFATPFPAANDLNRYWWMIVIVFAGLGAAERRNEHIEALVLETRMPPRLRVIWRYLRAGVVAVTLMLLLIAATPAAIRHQLQGEYAAGSEIVTWPTRFILLLGVAVFLAATVVKAASDRRALLEDPLEPIEAIA